MHENSAVKITKNGRHEDIMTGEEIDNLSKATELYQQKVAEEIYNID